MNTQERFKQRKSYTLMRVVYGVGMAALILTIGALMFFGDKWQISQIQELDPLMRYLFGGLCVVYGVFRLYRALKQKY